MAILLTMLCENAGYTGSWHPIGCYIKSVTSMRTQQAVDRGADHA